MQVQSQNVSNALEVKLVILYSSRPSTVRKRLVDHGVARTHGRPTARGGEP